MKLFNLDSPVMVFLSKVANLMILNVLTIICCIPILRQERRLRHCIM